MKQKDKVDASRKIKGSNKGRGVQDVEEKRKKKVEAGRTSRTMGMDGTIAARAYRKPASSTMNNEALPLNRLLPNIHNARTGEKGGKDKYTCVDEDYSR